MEFSINLTSLFALKIHGPWIGGYPGRKKCTHDSTTPFSMEPQTSMASIFALECRTRVSYISHKLQCHFDGLLIEFILISPFVTWFCCLPVMYINTSQTRNHVTKGEVKVDSVSSLGCLVGLHLNFTDT